MPDPLSISARVLAITSAAFTATVAIYKTIDGIKKHHKTLRDLEAELSSLSCVLQKLQEACIGRKDDFEALSLPLFQCAMTCNGFDAFIQAVAKEPTIVEWVKLKYKGDSIKDFKDKIASYKAL